MEEANRQYLGGVFDSEGSVYIQVAESNTTLGYRIRPKLMLNMKNVGETTQVRSLLCSFSEEHDVSYTTRESDGYNEGTQHWRWETTSNESAVTFLEAMLPYLRVKKRVAELVAGEEWYVYGEERFMELLKVREQVRELSADRQSKYDPEFFRNEFNRA